MRLHLTLLFFLLFLISSRAQINIDFGASAGISVYSGDLSPRKVGFSFEDLGPAGSVFFRFQFAPWMGIRTNFAYAYLNASDRRSGNLFRNLNFQTNIYEGSGILEISPTAIGYYDSESVFVPYIAIGVGVFGFNPKTRVDGELVELQPIGTEGQGLPGYNDYYNRTALNFPFGLGVKFVVNDKLSFGLDILGRKLQTDYLDDVSGTQIRYGDILTNKGPLAARLSNPNLPEDSNADSRYTRGGSFNDFYYLATINISYRIQRGRLIYKPGKKGIVCPRF